jgi:polar amino acid transport system permease protein
MDAIPDWFRQLYESTGLNFTVFYDAYDWNRYVQGLEMTLLLSVTTILASLVLGAVGALIQSGPSRLLRGLVNAFVVVFRNTPPLVQLFFFYFGLGTMLPATESASGMREPMLNNVQWAIISLSLFAAAFNVEIFRSGIEAVPKTTIEAAEALGYKRSWLTVISSCRWRSASACRR